MTTASSLPRQASTSKGRTVLLLATAVVTAVVVNACIALAAVAFGAPAGYGPLSVPAQALFTVIGVVVGWIGWTLVHARARNPRRVLRILVPVVTLASLVPDVLLLVFGFIPGTNLPAVAALMLMHLVVVACAVTAYVLAGRGRNAGGRRV
ncbi:DUF6069 family protein [Microbacterium sp. 1P10UB]|uniref:DUF6069 family protein n=1 Tax=unclassified Microbacterium TaxID=2609290 RepID=UPI0039A24511